MRLSNTVSKPGSQLTDMSSFKKHAELKLRSNTNSCSLIKEQLMSEPLSEDNRQTLEMGVELLLFCV